MKIYTKTGDSGKTGLFRGPRVQKHDLRVEAYGNVDECNATLGVSLGLIATEEIKRLVPVIQKDLFELGADLATPQQKEDDAQWRIESARTNRLEKEIDHYEATIPELMNFILPGGSPGGAHLHYARTVCRRAERSVTRLAEREKINPEIIRYLNRLSDLLFVMARAENQNCSSPETIWKKEDR